jgi:trimethylamine--corrinoid protein Co-methyltransferase
MTDNKTFEQWDIEGRIESEERARARAREMLASYQAPELDPAIDEALKDYIQSRKNSLPDSEY